MAKQFRVNQIILSGSDLSVNPTDTVNYFRHDGTFSNPVQGYVQSSETGNFITSFQTGQFYSSLNPNGYVTSSGFITGENNIGGGSGIFSGIINGVSQLKTLFGGSGINISGNSLNNSLTFSVTGINGGVGGDTYNNYTINSGSGVYIFRTTVTSGVSEQFVLYPILLDTSPIVITTLHNDISNSVLSYQISGANTSGFWVLFSADVNNSGYYLDSFVSNSTGTGLATNVIVNNNDYSSTVFPVITETGLARTLSLNDAKTWIRTTNASGVTINVPAQTGVAWPDYTEIVFEQAGSGQITFNTGIAGTTINSSSSYKTYGQYSVVSIKRVASGVWTLLGERE